MPHARQLEDALREWRDGDVGSLLGALGFERVGFQVPRESLSEFGLDRSHALNLEIAARRSSFDVLRIVLDGRLEPEAIRRAASALYRHNPTRRTLLILEATGDERLVFASWGLGPGPFRLAKLWIDPSAPRRSELDILAGLAANGVATASELALAHAQALDREAVTRRFFNQFRRQRAALAARLNGVPLDRTQDRLDLALILLSRLLFLYFVQRKGWLAGDDTYLRNLYEESRRGGTPFYRRRLKPLFFGALNRAPRARSQRARELGELPYLNGGLFERDALERAHPKLDVPDEAFDPVFDELLDKYQFTLREDQPADEDVAIDPEMLGRVFEGLMVGPVRGSSGAFFTPRGLVERLVRDALAAHLSTIADRDRVDALLTGAAPPLESATRERLCTRVRQLRVLDPAVGSGAFLLAALQALEHLRTTLEGDARNSFQRFQLRSEIIQRNLHGVDVSGAAVRLCELRLWLALVVDLEVDSIAQVPPLPNLDIKIRQGDALVDPIDFLVQLAGLDDRNLAGRWHGEVAALAKRKARYFRAAGSSKRRAGRALRKSEHDLAIRFLAELAARIDERRRDLRAAASSPDLFGKRAGLSASQRRAVRNLGRRRRQLGRLMKKIGELEELPFFSFPIHFADPESPDGRFHIIVGNPPWVRAHHWTGLPRAHLKQRYGFLRDAGWRAGARMAGAGRGFGAQLDLSALFLERSLELLADDGTLGFLLPSKLARALSAGALRQRLLRGTTLLSLEDHSAAPTRLFEATTYPLTVILRNGAPGTRHSLQVCLHDRRGELHDFRLPQDRLSLLSDDESPLALAPPSVRAAIGRMRAAGPLLGAQPWLRPARGIFTGANEIFVGEVIEVIEAKNGARLARLRIGASEAEIEVEQLRPALRGEDLEPWRFNARRVLIWTHADDGAVLPALPPATQRHLRKHERLLAARRDLKPGRPLWSLFRVAEDKSGRRLVWRDIGALPSAVVVPARVAFLGGEAPIISLNTVYQIPARTDDDAHFLAALLNSTAVSAYLKTIAQRASGGYFRFFASAVALLPLPARPDRELRSRCIRLSRSAHASGPRKESRHQLDELVARLYRLRSHEMEALSRFDQAFSNPEPKG